MSYTERAKGARLTLLSEFSITIPVLLAPHHAPGIHRLEFEPGPFDITGPFDYQAVPRSGFGLNELLGLNKQIINEPL